MIGEDEDEDEDGDEDEDEAVDAARQVLLASRSISQQGLTSAHSHLLFPPALPCFCFPARLPHLLPPVAPASRCPPPVAYRPASHMCSPPVASAEQANIQGRGRVQRVLASGVLASTALPATSRQCMHATSIVCMASHAWDLQCSEQARRARYTVHGAWYTVRDELGGTETGGPPRGHPLGTDMIVGHRMRFALPLVIAVGMMAPCASRTSQRRRSVVGVALAATS